MMKPVLVVHFFLSVFCATISTQTSIATRHLRSSQYKDDESPQQQQQQQRNQVAIQPRIIGGTTASAGEFPYFVEWVSCGATLIYDDILLSAGHCSGVKTNGVLVGAYKSFSQFAAQQQQAVVLFRTITARVVHPKFSSSSTGRYDFMVMQLDSPISPNLIKPVTLNSDPNVPNVGDSLTAIGFGYTIGGSSSSASTTLNKVNVNYVNTQTCNTNYGGGNKIDATSSFCAGVSGGGKDTCQGDSGGPILDSRGFQVGVTSNGANCGSAQYPGIYARVSSAIDWINQQVCALSARPPLSCGTTTGGGKSPTPAPIPVPAPSGTTTSVRIDLMYDLSSSETSWAMVNNAGKRVAASSSGKSNSLLRTYLQLDPGTYVLQLFDSVGDGFCCDLGVGYYGVYAVVNGAYVSLAQGSGAFQKQLNVPLSIPASGGTAPTPAPISPTPAPVAPTIAPVSPTQAPVPPTRVPPTKPTRVPSPRATRTPTRVLESPTPPPLDPVEPTLAPVEPTLAPVEPTLAPVEPTLAPVEPTLAPVEPTLAPVEPTTAPVEPTLAPVEPTLAPVAPTTAPIALPTTAPIIVFSPTHAAGGSSSPTTNPVVSTTSPPTLPTNARCIDSTSLTFSFSGNVSGTVVTDAQQQQQRCVWLWSRPAWVPLLCKPGQSAYQVCPKTCGQCMDRCQGFDDPTATFPINGVQRNCNWLRIRPHLWKRQCLPDLPPYLQCQEICGSC